MERKTGDFADLEENPEPEISPDLEENPEPEICWIWKKTRNRKFGLDLEESLQGPGAGNKICNWRSADIPERRGLSRRKFSRALAEKYGFELFDVDERFDEHKKMSNPLFQPAMNTYFNSADEFFGRTVEEYKNWLLNNTREQLEFVLLDLIRLSENKKVLCDCHLTVAQALAFSEPARVVFLIKDPSNLVDEYGNRPDHQGFFQYLNSATDIEKAKQTVNITLYELNVNRIEEIKSSSFFG